MLDEDGLAKCVRVVSAGTHAGRVSERADLRSQRICDVNGIKINKHRSRPVDEKDFERFDWILAMDNRNVEALMALCPDETLEAKIHGVLEWLPGDQSEVPDPYYGNEHAFVNAFELIREGVDAFYHQELLKHPALLKKVT